MITICNICLRSDRKLLAISDENLENFYEELCDYGNGDDPKFCSECIYKMNKCYEFKMSCRHAIDVLKKWKKQIKDVRKPINLLYTELPAPQLSLCNKNNFKVYYYQSADLEIAAPIQVSSSGQPNIVTLNIPRCDNIAIPSCSVVENVHEKITESTIIFKQEIDESMEFVDNDNQASEMINLAKIKIEHDNKKPSKESEELGSDDDLTDSDNEIINNQEIVSDSDESFKELEEFFKTLDKPKTKIIKRNTDINAKCTKNIRRYTKSTDDLDTLKTHLKEKFERHGDIKDDKGNVINKDTVINNLDKANCMHKLKKLCSGPGPFNALAIRKLSEIHSRFVYDSMFDIVVLKNEEQMRAEFEKRLMTDPSRPYRCNGCLKSFKTCLGLDSHSKRYHNEAYAFECTICHVRFRKKTMIWAHNTSCHNTMYKCKLCTNFTTCNRANMKEHYNQHKGIKLSCEYCGKCFTRPSVRALHINIVHEPQHICELCACAFMKPRGLEVHKILKHYDEIFVESEHNTKCEVCNVTFITEDVYLKHMKITHKVRSEYKRKKGPNTKRSGNITYSCRFCNLKGLTRVMQMEHYKTEHPNAEEEIQSTWKHLCHECGKRFKHLHEHRIHMNKHTGTKPYACKTCPKTFFSPLSLHTHSQRHLPPSFECSYCGKKFTTGTGLSSHKRIHINDRRFKCHICSKGFLYRGTLKQHVAGVHYNMKRVRKPRQQDMDCE